MHECWHYWFYRGSRGNHIRGKVSLLLLTSCKQKYRFRHLVNFRLRIMQSTQCSLCSVHIFAEPLPMSWARIAKTEGPPTTIKGHQQWWKQEENKGCQHQQDPSHSKNATNSMNSWNSKDVSRNSKTSNSIDYRNIMDSNSSRDACNSRIATCPTINCCSSLHNYWKKLFAE